MADRLRADQERSAAEQRAREAEASARAEAARERALAQVQERRENRLALAVLLLVLSLLAFGGAGILFVRNRQRQAIGLAAVGGVLLIAAVIAFFTRPSLADAQAPPGDAATNQAAAAEPARFAGRNTCTLVPERSRVTVSSTADVPLEWSETGCVNERTQYARNGETWSRVLVPAGEEAVSVVEFKPASGEYVVTRYLLDAQAMSRVRALRRDVDVKSCTADQEARTILADQQREIGAVLPRLPNERLVYRCRNDAAAS
jgi:hypothetical protein